MTQKCPPCSEQLKAFSSDSVLKPRLQPTPPALFFNEALSVLNVLCEGETNENDSLEEDDIRMLIALCIDQDYNFD